MSRKAYIRTTLEDGSIEEVEVVLDKPTKKPTKRKVKVSDDKDKEKQEEVKTPTTHKETISIKRTKS